MQLKKLGNSDLIVSSYCLGTMTFGETTGERDAHKQIESALYQGINFIDTKLIRQDTFIFNIS